MSTFFKFCCDFYSIFGTLYVAFHTSRPSRGRHAATNEERWPAESAAETATLNHDPKRSPIVHCATDIRYTFDAMLIEQKRIKGKLTWAVMQI